MRGEQNEMRLSDVVSVDSRFEQSVNLMLDLNNEKKIEGYIPTRSSVNILQTYINDILDTNGSRATTLIGPYGKGKSHLLLVLLSLLRREKSKSMSRLINRVRIVDEKIAEDMEQIQESFSPFLPVILFPGQENLSNTFMKALSKALREEGLKDLVPDEYFSEAIKTIKRWKQHYTVTYEMFKELLMEPVETFIKKLEMYDEKAMLQFRKMYPALTSGGEYNPVITDDVLQVYRSVNRKLRVQYGYKGMIIVFDEFSKYIEGHEEQGFARDMKTLQDMCELANASREEQLHLICVAHKSIKAYGNLLSKEIMNAFKGVEGRLKERLFIVSSKNNYELIADAIIKNSGFESWAAESERMRLISKRSYQLRSFQSLFTQTDFLKIVARGCYPLTPVAAMLLLHLSEKVAQNERTIFTYITSTDVHGLARRILTEETMTFIGADEIYDYFEPLFKTESGNIHHEWLKASYALEKVEAASEKRIIKVISILRMIDKPDEMPVQSEYLSLACGLTREEAEAEIEQLEEAGIVEYRKRNHTYDFKNNIGIDLETAISDCIQKWIKKADVASALLDSLNEKYVLPKRHNQNFCITRYYNYRFMTAAQYETLSDISYLEWENNPDGVIICILPEEELDHEKIECHTAEINNPCLLVCLPSEKTSCADEVYRLLAIRRLKSDQSFIEETPAISKELEEIEKECIDNLNSWFQNQYIMKPEVYNYLGSVHIGAGGMNRAVSESCDQAYTQTPRINHELINRHEPSSQICKARNAILQRMLDDADVNDYLTGSSSDATIYRAVMEHTENDEALAAIRNEIHAFIMSGAGTKVSFAEIMRVLTAVPYGVRKGVIPFYLLDELLKLNDIPVIYLGSKEVMISVETINNVVRKPEEYSLYVERETMQKNEYIDTLEKMYMEYSAYCRDIDRKNRYAKIACLMQSWFRSLPQCSKTFTTKDRQTARFRKVFAEMFLNPRDILFESIPRIFGTNDFSELTELVTLAKREIDAYVHELRECAETLTREAFGIEKNADLARSLHEWVENLPEAARKGVFSDQTRNVLNYLSSDMGRNAEDIVGKLAKELTGIFIEDWKDEMQEQYKDALEAFLSEINSASDIGSSNYKVQFTTPDGKNETMFYEYDPENESSNAFFFRNAIESAMEEYDGFMDNREKVAILFEMAKKLMEGES